MASVFAITDLLGLGERIVDKAGAMERLEMLLDNDRLFAWGEGAVPHLLAIQWYAEKQEMRVDALPGLKSVILAICERNHNRAEDECFAPPKVSPDEILTDLSALTHLRNRIGVVPAHGLWRLWLTFSLDGTIAIS